MDESDLQLGSNSADQLAELQLLTRADHHGGLGREPKRYRLDRGGSTLMLDIAEHPDEDGADEESEDERSVQAAGSSSFTALLAASRRMAGKSPTALDVLPRSSTADHIESMSQVEQITDNRSGISARPTTLSTLCEEASDPATEEESDSTVAVPRDQNIELKRASGSSSISGATPRERNEDCSISDPAFEDMLEQLPYDLSFLLLSVTDLTVENLIRTRDAIARGSLIANAAQQHQSGSANVSLSQMRLVRTLLALDTLRLFLLRYEEEEVLLAVTDAIRRIYGQYVRDHGVRPLSHSECVVTSSNIARVVLYVRETLSKQDVSAMAIDNNSAERSSPSRSRRSGSSPSKSFCASPRSWRSLRSPSSSSSSKTPFSPRSAAPASPRSPGSSTPNSSVRRSILASDGAHVLMSEKLAVYQHRGDVDRLPSFKVRRESEDAVEEAAMRRQRSIHYGNEVTRSLRG